MDEPTPSDMSEQRPRFRYVERGRTPLAVIDMSPITEDFSDPCQKITLDLTKPITIEFSGRISHSPPATTLRTPDFEPLGDPNE